MTTETLLRTPFHEFHVGQGAKLVEFAGWEMPMLYGSIHDEHRQVRTSAGLFDVSHMGRLRFTGADACRFLDRVCTRAIDGMADGQARYSLVCNATGGCRDDVIVYRLGDREYVMVCNAANRAKLLEHFEAERGDLDFQLADETVDSGMLALQGPKVIEMIAAFAPEIAELKRFRFVCKNVMGADVMICRTGYTGEDGVEVIVPAAIAPLAIGFLAGNVGDGPIGAAGLGARDTLRLEAAMPLYGQEITEEIDPLAAGLNFAVKLDKPQPFIGQDALQKIAASGPPRTLAGLVLDGRRTARGGMAVRAGDAEIGIVTSACLSPTLGKPIAMAYVDATHNEPGKRVEIALGEGTSAEVIRLPFYKRS